MSERVVISCPACLRRYWVELATEDNLARCGGCKATFTLVIPRLPESPLCTLDLHDEVYPIDPFFGDALEALLRHSCFWMAHKGESEITPQSLMEFIEKVTSDRVCDQVVEFGVHHSAGSPDEEALEYFVHSLAVKPSYARRDLRLAIAGMIRGIDWTVFGPKAASMLYGPPCSN
jgi:hypothetical protein